MKTLILQGEQKKFEYLYKNITLDDKDKDLIPYEVEMRVYIVNVYDFEFDESPTTWEDSKFISEAEIQGRVYTLPFFQEAFNGGEINTVREIVRFITAPLNI